MRVDAGREGDAVIKYFAYGSNMYSRRLAARVRSSRFYAIAWLANHRLAFHKRGSDGSGKCSVVSVDEAGGAVPGVVYAIDEADRRTLDGIEGVGHGYEAVWREVTVNGRSESVYLYVAEQYAVDDSVKPFCWYRDFVVAGAREHGFPEAYLRWLAGVSCVRDPRPDRERRNRRLLAE